MALSTIARTRAGARASHTNGSNGIRCPMRVAMVITNALRKMSAVCMGWRWSSSSIDLSWIVGGIVLQLRIDPRLAGFIAQASLIERFDLFVIIVLGEVVVGVVTGLSTAPHDAKAIATGLLGLMIG